jgi:hypothetical protein
MLPIPSIGDNFLCTLKRAGSKPMAQDNNPKVIKKRMYQAKEIT